MKRILTILLFLCCAAITGEEVGLYFQWNGHPSPGISYNIRRTWVTNYSANQMNWEIVTNVTTTNVQFNVTHGPMDMWYAVTRSNAIKGVEDANEVIPIGVKSFASPGNKLAAPVIDRIK